MIEKAKAYAIKHHGNQKYGHHPYVYHLDAVAEIVNPYGEQAVVLAYLHDVVEDTDITSADIQKEFGDFIAECVSILTDQPGSNRKERKSKTYNKMSSVSGELELALLVKTADRLANINACIEDGHSKKLAMYQKEHEIFKQSVYRKNLCESLWDQLNSKVAGV